jgi:hypothetical protein
MLSKSMNLSSSSTPSSCLGRFVLLSSLVIDKQEGEEDYTGSQPVPRAGVLLAQQNLPYEGERYGHGYPDRYY